jgi:NACHT domain
MTDGTRRTGITGFLVAVFVLPAVTAGLGKSFVAHHPALTFAIWLVYEAIVLIAGFSAHIVNDLLALWRQPIVAYIDSSVRRQRRRFEKRYLEVTLAGLKTIDQKGLSIVGEFAPSLDAVFRELALVSRPPQDIQPAVLIDLASEQAERPDISDLLSRREPRVLAVVGAPGSGKTTLLRHAARQACLSALSRRGRRPRVRRIPILLYLREHATVITADPSVSLPRLVRESVAALDAKEPAGWFEEKLCGGECLVLLDGLDEVALPGDRSEVAAWVERQVQAYTRNDFVVTSRPLGYQSARLESADIVQPCGFTADQVTQFVHDWYREVEVHTLGGNEAKAEADTLEGREKRAREQADDLLKNLVDVPALYDLAVNPLLLTMIANLHRHRKRHGDSLPRTRASLYFEICEVTLGGRQKAKGVPQPLNSGKKKEILARLACAMMDRRVSELDRAEVVAIIRPVLPSAPGSVSPDEFLAEVRSDGLLVQGSNERYTFAHKTFQEYLAAAHIQARGEISKLSGVVNDDWWTEVILFYAGHSDASPVILACLEADTISALALALECAEQCGAFNSELDARLTAVRAAATSPGELDSSAPELRRLAGILLSMHLRHRSRACSGSQVCVRPIPAEIYRLFLADTQVHEPDANPAILQAPAGIAVGIRADDAQAFVTWANAITGSQPTYRLPLAAELNDLAARQRIPALPSGDLPDIWAFANDTPPGSSPQLHQFAPRIPSVRGIDEVSLTAAIQDDLAAPVPLLGTLLLLRSRLAAHLPPFLLSTYSYGDGAPFEGDSDPALTDILAPAPELASSLGLDFSLSLAAGPAFDPDLAFMLAQARAHEIDFDGALAHARKSDLNLARAVARSLSTDAASAPETDALAGRTRRQGSLDDLIQSLLESAMRLVAGDAFSWALTQARRTATQSQSPIRRFAAAFVSAAGVVTANPVGNPDLLPETSRRALQMLEEALGTRSGGPGSATWASVVAERLARNAEPVFSRVQRPSRETSSAIRLAALCLAAEADALGLKEIGDMLREVAVGITWLQKRAAGDIPATEVIMLAVE